MTPESGSPQSPAIRLSLNPKLVAALLAAMIVFFGSACIIIALLQKRLPGHPLYGLPRFLDLGGEGNLPSYYSALCLLAAGLLGLLIAQVDAARQKTGWLGLGLGFIGLSFDEAAQIHDGLINPAAASVFGSFETPALHYGWVAVALGAVAVIAVLYLGFLARLPRGYAAMLIISALVYLGGAIGMEMLEAHFVATDRWPQGWFPWRMLAEEMGEMTGATLYLLTLLHYLARLNFSWHLSIARTKERQAPPLPSVSPAPGRDV